MIAMHSGSKAVATDALVRPFRDDDWTAVHAVYAQGIATGNATFETEVPAFERWSATHPPELRFVADQGGKVVGWVAASPFPTDAPTPAWSNTACTWTQTRAARESAACSWRP